MGGVSLVGQQLEHAVRRLGAAVLVLAGDQVAVGHHVGVAATLNNMGIQLRQLARTGEALDCLRESLQLALAQADLGIAMSSGTGAAIETANLVVPSDRVLAVADAVYLSRRTLRTIRQNLFLAFVYNSVAIPAAAFGLLGPYGPLIAAAAMGLSDVSVIGNALRLKASLNRKA